MTGSNFGSGSSRQQAVDCFRALGVAALVAESFGAIYKRNAINSGFAILTLPDLHHLASEFDSEDCVEIDLAAGRVRNRGKTYQAEPFSQVQMDIYQAGNLFTFGGTLES
jgi:3-isopropylmalate/(R)-2-methylmalate dehydratase small subunit